MSNKENQQTGHSFDRPIKWLVYFCVGLVGAVILWVAADTICNICYKNKVLQRLEEIQYVTADVVQPCDSSLVLTGLDIKRMMDTAIVEESTIMDSNNYLAIILTLITLCVSLSVVIPYIVGRSISAKTIKDTVDEIYTKDKHNSEVKYRKSVERLLLAEGHLSRMTAYMLLHSAKDEYKFAAKTYDEKIHPYWALGWASKALIRYLKCYSQCKDEYNSAFVEDCVRYIVDASNAMSSQGISKEVVAKEGKDKIIRAFIDIVDVIGFAGFYQGMLACTQLDKIRDAAKALCRVIKDYRISKGEIYKIAILKSKYREYLISSSAVIPTKEEYLAFLQENIDRWE